MSEIPPRMLNEAAESAVIGSVLLHPEILDDARWVLRAADFHTFSNQRIWETMLELRAEGQPVDQITVPARLPNDPDAAKILHEALNGLPASSNWKHYAKLVIGSAQSRELLITLSTASIEIEQGVEATTLAERLQASLARLGDRVDAEPADVASVDVVAARPDSDMPPWVVEHWLRSGDRVMMVAEEGVGKSVITMQWAMQIAQGVNPLWPTAQFEPSTVLVIDLENPEYELRERIRTIRKGFALNSYVEGLCYLWHRPAGIDLRSRVSRGELDAVLARLRPSLVVLSPLYKAVRARPKEDHEAAASALQEVLDDLRARYGFALFIEHHAPKGTGGQRDFVPFGSSLWLRWPEYGITLRLAKEDKSELVLGRFRGDRHRNNGWPTHLRWGSQWPWVAVYASRRAPWFEVDQGDEEPW